MEEGRMASAEFDNPQPDIEIRDVNDHQIDDDADAARVDGAAVVQA
jgi:hypothetical protein